ncbi:MAG: transposase, partial [Patescibacteria group bacterium]
MRSITFETDEFYHVFNRGNNKRPIFLDEFDLLRFLQSMREFNTVEPIGSIYENFFRKKELGDSIFKQQKLVDLVCYCLNPNHFHLTVKQLVDDGVRRFMHRVGTGFTKYFNQKYKTSGALFQGRYKALHVDSNEYLLHLSAYVNLNNRVHGALG